jgi:3D (Asp-Asp-Asp) domain-containing protein
MKKILDKADRLTKNAFYVVLILFAVTLVLGKVIRPVSTVGAGASKATTLTTEAVTNEEPMTVSLGEFYITVYTPYCDEGVWGYQTATGVRSESLKTCAVDPSVIPLGTTILVDDICLKAVDTGSAVKGKVIDIFYDGTKEEATEWLSQLGTVHEVYEVKK